METWSYCSILADYIQLTMIDDSKHANWCHKYTNWPVYQSLSSYCSILYYSIQLSYCIASSKHKIGVVYLAILAWLDNSYKNNESAISQGLALNWWRWGVGGESSLTPQTPPPKQTTPATYESLAQAKPSILVFMGVAYSLQTNRLRRRQSQQTLSG